MIIQVIKFESELSEDEVLTVAKERVDQFQALPGLLQKYYVKVGQPNQYGGIYIWDSMESLSAYRESDLAASIPAAYKVKGTPSVEILETLFQLRN
jgi:heme-degrading monooxygenase HmoA